MKSMFKKFSKKFAAKDEDGNGNGYGNSEIAPSTLSTINSVSGKIVLPSLELRSSASSGALQSYSQRDSARSLSAAQRPTTGGNGQSARDRANSDINSYSEDRKYDRSVSEKSKKIKTSAAGSVMVTRRPSVDMDMSQVDMVLKKEPGAAPRYSNGVDVTNATPTTIAVASGNSNSSTTSAGLTKNDLLKNIATLAETPLTGRPALLVHKLRLCCIQFDWTNVDPNPNSLDNKAREAKRVQLAELVEYIGKNQQNKNIYTEQVLAELMNMIIVNLFRALPPRQEESVSNKTGGGEGDEDDPVYDPSFPHLQGVYELFFRFIVNNDVDMKLLKKWINNSFISRLLDLFDSEDPREREFLKTILHRIYAKFMSLRAFIRKAINNVFFLFVYETERHNGIGELLEILGSIINGFALPLKAEHKTFLRQVLLPLHSAQNFATFNQQLAYCVAQFVDKDPTLAAQVLVNFIRYWPHQTAQKQLLFLNELEELLELCQPEQFRLVAVPIARTLAAAINSPHFQVAERALFLWHNEYIANLIAEHRKQMIPILYNALYTNSQPYEKKTSQLKSTGENVTNAICGHWNPTVNSLTVNVLKIFMELDQPLLESCQKTWQDRYSKQARIGKQRLDNWQRLHKEGARLTAQFQNLKVTTPSVRSGESHIALSKQPSPSIHMETDGVF